MDKSKIPVEKLTLDDGTEVSFYSWLTQEEEDKFNLLLLGDQNFSELQGQVTTKLSNLNEAKAFRMKSLLISPTYEEVNVSSPDLRTEIISKISNLIDKKK